MPKHKCPVCGKTEFEYKGSYDICENCGWEDDEYQENHPDNLGANEYSLNVYKKKYDSGWRPDWLKKML